MGNPIVMDGTQQARHRMPPRLGEDTAEVLRDVLGYSGETIGGLARRGSIQLDAGKA
jgi:crotonobetainyl-CoA:carnitine CoA-transferase CaiB-like acyl-CoA transferase